MELARLQASQGAIRKVPNQQELLRETTGTSALPSVPFPPSVLTHLLLMLSHCTYSVWLSLPECKLWEARELFLFCLLLYPPRCPAHTGPSKLCPMNECRQEWMTWGRQGL